MHCLKPIHDIAGKLHINILNSKDINRIDICQWQQLQRKSLTNNPFFEDWNLIPALKHLTDNQIIYLVTVHIDKELVALFPVQKHKVYGVIPCLSVWQHDHAYIGDPLYSIELDWPNIFRHIAHYLSCALIKLPNHKISLKEDSGSVYSARYQRAGISSNFGILHHLNSLAGKKYRELNRTKRKLENKFSLDFFEFEDIKSGLEAYQLIEHGGWKGKKNGSILSKKPIAQYYKDLFATKHSNHLRVFALTADSKIIACAIRIESDGHIYEVKTSYDESYRRYAPGKILEWHLINQLSQQPFSNVDSCTHPNNTMINWLWPDQITYYQSNIFSPSQLGQFTKKLHLLKRWISERYSHG